MQTTNLVIKGQNGREVTTSQIVAQVFRKNHSDVLRDIRNLHCSKEFQDCNFALLVEMRELPQGGATKSTWCEMTKDGFSFLVMGYTGEKAAEFKEAFIAEFNNRERMLQSDDYILARSQEILKSRLQAAEELLEAKTAELAEKEEVIGVLAPKAEYTEKVLHSESTLNVNSIAAELGVTAQCLNAALASMGVQYKQGNQWLLCSEFRGLGYTKTKTYMYSETSSSVSTVWTQKGRAFILYLTRRSREGMEYRRAIKNAIKHVEQLYEYISEDTPAHPDLLV